MLFETGSSRPALAAAAIALVAAATPLTASAATYLQDEDQVVEEDKKADKKRKKIRIITSGGPIYLETDKNGHETDHKHIYRRHKQSADSEHHATPDVRHEGLHSYSFKFEVDDKRQKTISAIEEALEAVKSRVGKARKKDRKALEAAEKGLTAALEGLKDRHGGGWHALRSGVGGSQVLGEMMRDFEIDDRELHSMRLHDLGLLPGIRGRIADVLEGVEVEIDVEGDVKTLHFDSLGHHGNREPELSEGRVEALKQAEESLRRARTALEKRLAEKKTTEQKDKVEK